MRKSFSKISNEMQKIIRSYYENDENTYTYPGKRDYVSTHDKDGKKIFVQKKLLLYTVYDLYLKFLNEYTGDEKPPSFSYFTSLKPVECIRAGDPGSHTICVCTQHQNIKLKLYALSRKLNYRDLLPAAVCKVDDESCMTKQCKNCPGQEGVLRRLEQLMEELEIESKEGQVTYKVWDNQGSAACLKSNTVDFTQLKIQICADINLLTTHHFIAETQKRYLNYCKDHLDTDTCIIMEDFSENYSFIIQQSVQAFYYNNSQATVHPFCIYFKTEGNDELQNVNFCIISDSTDHSAYTVNAFTAKLMSVIREQYLWIKKVIYFSDGAPTQYKNKYVTSVFDTFFYFQRCSSVHLMCFIE